MSLQTFDTAAVKTWLLDLQARIVAALEAADGLPFRTDSWERPEGGGGISRLIEEGNVLERGGVNFSHVLGSQLPPSASAHRPELAGRRWEAMGVSLVLHPRNPYAPTVHMNVRCFVALKDGEAPVWWFGGGMDLTPYYGFEEDARHFHVTCKTALDPFGAGAAPALQGLVRPLFLPQASQRAARHRRRVLRRFRRRRLRPRLRHDPQRGRRVSRLPTCPSSNAARIFPTASASAISRPTGADATSSSTWCSTAAPCSACSRADAPSRS